MAHTHCPEFFHQEILPFPIIKKQFPNI